MIKADCHIHAVLDGKNWRAALLRHADAPDRAAICAMLETYRRLGYTYLRDGGDRFGVGKAARELAPRYGLRYRTPLAPLYFRGHYGAFIGVGFTDLHEYAALVAKMGEDGCDFIKLMLSGLMDFDRFGHLSEPELPPKLLRELIDIAHDMGFSVMAHANGAQTLLAAARSGVDSVEHGAYADDEALAAMAENRVIWVPTLSAIANLRGTERYDERAVRAIFDSAAENLCKFAAHGGLIAPGSDAGAWGVPHGCETEPALLREVLGERAQELLQRGTEAVMERF